MIFTTTPTIEGHPITAYLGVVTGEVITGINFIKDFSAGLTNIFGGRSADYEGELISARNQALGEMEQQALSWGATAIVGIDFDYEVLGQAGNMMMVTVTGTAVQIN